MKNIGIITHYDVHNHGALLQLTALIRVLSTKDVEAKALRFDKNYDFLGHDLKSKYEISTKSIGIYCKYLKEKGLGCTKYNYLKRKILLNYKKALSLIGDFYTESPELDAVIIGSDEVFALHTGPTPVFFGHCLPTNNVVSYAGSFGPTTYEEIRNRHSIPFIQSGLQAMKGITVRDENSATIIKTLIGIEPHIVVDPVLLYGFEEEIQNSYKPNIDNYLLVYAYDNRMNSPEEIAAIQDYAKLKGLKILSVGFYHKWCDHNINVDPITLLAYFKNAVEIVTDTFHGCIMSIITNSKFIVKTRKSNYLKIKSLLEDYSLATRAITNWKELQESMAQDINYEFVNKELERRRSESRSLLFNMLEI